MHWFIRSYEHINWKMYEPPKADSIRMECDRVCWFFLRGQFQLLSLLQHYKIMDFTLVKLLNRFLQLISWMNQHSHHFCANFSSSCMKSLSERKNPFRHCYESNNCCKPQIYWYGFSVDECGGNVENATKCSNIVLCLIVCVCVCATFPGACVPMIP